MNYSIYTVIAILTITQLISGALIAYIPPKDSHYTIVYRDPDSYSWLIQGELNGGDSYYIESFRYDSALDDKSTTFGYDSGASLTIKAISKKTTCAALYDSTTNKEKLIIAQFIRYDNHLVEDLINSSFPLTAANASTTTYEVADLCSAIKINGRVYHLDTSSYTQGQTKYKDDTLPTTPWTNPVFNDDFSYVAGDKALYKYTASTKTYASVLNNTFYTNKKVWTTIQAILVLSWVLTTENSYNYSLQAFSIPTSGTTYTLVGKIQGTYYDTNGNPPTISLSETLKTVVVYANADATTFFAKGKTFDYTLNKDTEFTIPAWITETQSDVSVSDSYLYARNIEDVAGSTGVKEHGAYFIANTILTEYFVPVPINTEDEIQDWIRTKVMETKSGELDLIREHVSSSNIITLQQSVSGISYQLQPFSWNKKLGRKTSIITGPGTSFDEKNGQPRWFEQAFISQTVKKFHLIRANPKVVYSPLISTYEGTQSYSLKSVSSNYQCALIYENYSTQLKIVSFSEPNALRIGSVPASLYDRVDLDADNNTFDVSDDCMAVRINKVIGHNNTATKQIFIDTYPDGTTQLTNPVFTGDFSLAVTDTGIYSYTPANQQSDGIYNLDRAYSFDTNKKVFKSASNLLIFTYASINNTHYLWKVQLNTIKNASSTNFTQFTGTVQTNPPNILVSPKLTKIILQGASPTDSTASVFVGKSIDWTKKVVKDMTLSINTTGLGTQIALSDDYLYVNYAQTYKTHVAYMLMGSSCIQIFNEPFPYPTINYKRSFIFEDQDGFKKLILGHQYSTDEHIRMLLNYKNQFKKYVNVNPVTTSEISFTWGGQQNSLSSRKPPIGKWLDINQTGVLNYYEYDASVSNKLKTITNTSIPNDASFTAYSQEFDCAIMTGSQDVQAFMIDSQKSTATSIPGWANLVGSYDLSKSDYYDAVSNQKISTGSNCWAVRVGNVVLFKSTDNSAYTKSSSTFTEPVFDLTLNFVYDSGKVYRHNGTDYAQAFTVAGLKKKVVLTASQDNFRLAILSFQDDNNGGFLSVFKIYIYSNNTWTNASLPSDLQSFTALSASPQIFANSALDVMGISYPARSGEFDYIPMFYICTIETTTNTINTLNMQSKFNYLRSSLKTSIFGSYVHFIHLVPSMIGDIFYEYIYQVDKINGLLVLIDSRSFIQNIYNPIWGYSLSQQSGKISVRYQYHRNDAVVLKIRVIGTPNQRAFAKGIHSKYIALTIQNNLIYTCPPGCSYCIHPNTCETCLSGFVLDQNNICIKCGPSCDVCTINGPPTCMLCTDGFFLEPQSQSCVQCNTNCFTCVATTEICTSCKTGFYLFKNICYSCIDNCISCSKATSSTDPLCDICIPGYAYNKATKTCAKCITGCSLCNPDKIYECIRCGEGFETTKVNNVLTCKKCPNNCRICQNGVCQVCRDGLRLMNNTCVAQCNLPCKQCSTTNGSVCTSCIGGFTLDGRSCIPDLTCNSNGNCSFCPFGYNLFSGRCYKCQGGSNCQVCDNLNIETCVSCNKGYFLDSAETCQICKIPGCADCKDQQRCQQCKPGYVLEATVFGQCLPCDSRCKTCYENPTNCGTCADGFTKQGLNCINANNINITLKISVSLSQFTTENYSSIEQAICEAVTKDKKYFTIHQIKSGSVVIVGTIDVDNTAQQTAMMASLQSLLTTGSSIGGFPIESTSLTANNGDNAQTQPQTQPQTLPQQLTQTVYVGDNGDANYYKNVAIIVGVVIPIGLIIILLVVLVLYKKGIICQPKNDSKVTALEMDSVQIQQKTNGQFN